MNGKTIEEIADEYYENLYLLEEEEPQQIKERINDKFKAWLVFMESGDYSDGLLDSDLYYSFWEDFITRNEANNEILVYVDSFIFATVIENWDECPYNGKYKFGINFKKLYKFYDKLKNIIINTDDEVEKIVRVYILERFFGISLISKLADYMLELKELNDAKYKDKLEKYKSYNKEYVDIVDNEFKWQEKKRILKNNIDDKFSYLIGNYGYLSDLLLILSKIVAIPMVFSRDKYIEKISTSYEKNKTKFNKDLQLEYNLYYLNYYMIPLLSKVYYFILIQYIRTYKIDMKSILEKYIKQNFQIYDYKKFCLKDKKSFEKKIGEAFQINITEIIYNYNQGRIDFKNDGENIIEIVKKLKNDCSNLIQNNFKYNFQAYNLGFPQNTIYSIYKNNKDNINKG